MSGYTLSGTIAEGSNTITVTYQGKTATFTVTGVAESGGGEETTTPFGVEWTEGYMLLNAEPYVNAKYVVSDYINVSGKTEIRIHYDGTGGKTINFQIESYDTAKKRLKDYSANLTPNIRVPLYILSRPVRHMYEWLHLSKTGLTVPAMYITPI